MRTPAGGSSFKSALAALEPGTRIAATQIAGDFTLPRDASIPLVMLAGGIGMTPFASQLSDLVARGERRNLVVIVVPSSADEVLYRDTIEAAGARLVVMPRDELTPDALQAAVPDISSRRAFVSGAPGLVSAGRSALRRAGAKRIKTDYFAGY